MICVDASVAAKWILREEWRDQAIALYYDALHAGERIVAPPLLPIEVTNILWQRVRASSDSLSLEEAVGLLDEFLEVSIEIHDLPDLHRQALILADAFGLPAAYDAHYLALAERFGCIFWTADQRLLRAVGDRLPFVRPIRDYGMR
jgi:predicted nucleic acid-binding protein